MDTWVTMVNPHTGDTQKVLEESFNKLWKSKGWTIQEAPPVAEAAVDESGPSKASKSKASRGWETNKTED